MYLFSNLKTECCGCKVCQDVCPTKCISFKEDEESFIYPYRDINRCIECNLCVSVCPFASDVKKNIPNNQKVGVHKNIDTIYRSSSGGAFSAICEQLTLREYKVYGVKLDNNLKCVYDNSENNEIGWQKFRKSKYIQADTNHVYLDVMSDLQDERNVLFAGLPCQNAALLLFLGKKDIKTNNLLVIDILCHGVVSQKLFDSYINELESDNKGKVTGFVFRNKAPIDGKVNSRSVEVNYENGTTAIYGIANSAYLKGYHNRLFYRPSCYYCPFANVKRVSDITLADAWGIEKVYPEWNSLAGVSLILANTKKGVELLNELSDNNMCLRDVELSWAIAGNDTLRCPTHLHPKRKKFFVMWKKKGFSNAVKRYAIPRLPQRVVNRMIRYLKNNLFNK